MEGDHGHSPNLDGPAKCRWGDAGEERAVLLWFSLPLPEGSTALATFFSLK